MLRVICWTFVATVAGAILNLLGMLLFVELIQPWLVPPKPGEGFNAEGFMLYVCGTPCTAVVGGTIGLSLSLHRRRKEIESQIEHSDLVDHLIRGAG